MAWQSISSAPQSEVILLFGKLDVLDDQKPLYGSLDTPVRATGYWDDVDEAWSVVGGTWEGPWISATHWAVLPPAPPERNPNEHD